MSSPQAAPRISLLLTGGALVILSQWPLQDLTSSQRYRLAWFTAAGALFFLLGLLSIRRGEEPNRIERWLARLGAWLKVKDWQVVLLATSPIFALVAPLAAGASSQMISPAVAVAAWLIAIALALRGGRALGSAGVGGETEPVKAPRLAAILWALTLTALAFLPRGLATDRIPILLTGDEGSAGLEAVHFVEGRMDNIFISGWYGFPTLYYFLQSLSVRLFGQTTEALRIPSALAGAMTVTALYFTARAMFGQRAGLLAATFLAAYNFHIHFSRIGLNNVWDGLWYTIVIGALWYGWEHERRSAYLLAGFGLGMAQYYYPSGRLLPAILLAWMVIAALLDRHRLKRALPDFLLLFLTAAVVALPLAWHYAHNPNDFLAPLERVSLFGSWLENRVALTGEPGWSIILNEIGASFLAFTYTPLRFWYQPDTPLLRPLPSGLFLLGLILLAMRGRDGRVALPALWLVSLAIMGGLSESTPAAQRYVAIAPACALVVAYGLSESAALLERLWPARARLIAAVTVLLGIFLAADELRFYFLEYTPASVVDQAASNGMVAQRLADYLKDKPPDWKVVFFGQPRMGYRSIPSLQYLAPRTEGIDVLRSWDLSENPGVNGEHLVFVFLPDNKSEIAKVMADYPAGHLQANMAVNGEVLFWLYEYHTQ